MNTSPFHIRTERLLLRPCVPGDLDDLFAIYDNAEVAFYALPGAATRPGVERGLVQPRSPMDGCRFGVELDGKVIGDIILEFEVQDATASLSYAVAREYWGHGYATEATHAAVSFAFCDLGLAKVFARADPRNVASIRVLEKLGMRKEAHLRSHVIRRGERCDRVWYGILRDEWNPLTLTLSRGEREK